MPDVTPYAEKILDKVDVYVNARDRSVAIGDFRTHIRQVLVEATDHAAAIREQDFETMQTANAMLQEKVDVLEAEVSILRSKIGGSS